jgi:hypothetical protein
MIQFDALPMYNKGKKYSDAMVVEEVPETERKLLARQVADIILDQLRNGARNSSELQTSNECNSCQSTQVKCGS